MRFVHTPDGGMAIDAKTQGQITFNADGTLGTKVAPDLKSAPAGTLATVGTVRQMNRMPIFFNGHHDGDRASLIRVFNGMATPDDGEPLTALTHPGIVLGVLRGDVKSCTDAEWLADPYKRGMWSKGNAYLDEQGKPQGWVRMSDRNGVQDGSLPAPFWRGGIDAKVGSIGKDTMRRLEGKVGAIGFNYRESVIDLEGVFELGTPAAAIASNGAGGQPGNTGFKFDSAKGLPAGHTGTEFAPWNITGVSYTITANGIVNEAALDAAGVMAQVLLQQERVAACEAAISLLNNRRWDDVSGWRSVGTAYQNLWGYQIAISVTTASSGALLEVSPNGVNWYRLGKDGAERSQLYADIPDKWWYRVIGGSGVDIWSQLA